MRKPDQRARANSSPAMPNSLNSAAIVSVMLNPGFKAASRDWAPSDARLSSSLIEKDVQDARSIVDFLKLLTLGYNSMPVITSWETYSHFFRCCLHVWKQDI